MLKDLWVLEQTSSAEVRMSSRAAAAHEWWTRSVLKHGRLWITLSCRGCHTSSVLHVTVGVLWDQQKRVVVSVFGHLRRLRDHTFYHGGPESSTHCKHTSKWFCSDHKVGISCGLVDTHIWKRFKRHCFYPSGLVFVGYLACTEDHWASGVNFQFSFSLF